MRFVMQMPTVLDVFSSFYPSLSSKETMILFTLHTRYRLDMAGVVGSTPTRPTSSFSSSISMLPTSSKEGVLTRLDHHPAAALQKTEAAYQFWHQFHQYCCSSASDRTGY
jgi:hypothetical protein